MREYNSKRPLIFIHVPKCGGTSFRSTMEEWFQKKLYRHYFNNKRGSLPRRHRLKKFLSDGFREGVCIYGHFNTFRGFGIADYYPEVDQFLTILRDPFEIAVSAYFYMKKHESDVWDKSRVPTDSLEDYLMRMTPNILNHFPFDLDMDNYRDILERYFIHVGITEDMQTTAKVIARKLGMPPPADLKVRNRTKRSGEVPSHLKDAFMEKHPLEYALYRFAQNTYDKY